MTLAMRARRLIGVVAFVAGLCMPASVAAQAWLSRDGEGTVSITYQGLYSADHLDLNGKPFDKGRVTAHMLLTGLQYGLTDRLMLDARVTGVMTRYAGIDEMHGPLDNERYHATAQDARLGLAWQMRGAGPVAVAPYVAVVFPTHGYETRGHSAPGRRLVMLQMGAWVGRPLGSRAYVQGQGTFALVNRVADMSIHRSLFEGEFGYAVASRLSASAIVTMHRTHGGIVFPLSPHLDEHERHDHDRIARDNFILLSGGVTVTMTRRTVLYGTVIRTLSGQNTHKVIGGTIGVAYRFGGGLSFGR